jgi:hypothetical protein
MKAVKDSYKVSLRITKQENLIKLESPYCYQKIKIWPVQFWETK